MALEILLVLNAGWADLGFCSRQSAFQAVEQTHNGGPFAVDSQPVAVGRSIRPWRLISASAIHRGQGCSHDVSVNGETSLHELRRLDYRIHFEPGKGVS